MNNKQNFSDKIVSAILIIFFMKLIYILFQSAKLGFGGVVAAIIVSLVVFFILVVIAQSFDGSLFSDTGSSSNVLVRDSIYSKIHQKYRELAQKYIDEKDYRKASHIYFKLLKDKYSAAETLEQGNLHNEAALIYLKHLNNKYKAAECFENGKMYNQAIKLYTELENHEKVGDLNLLLNNEKEAKKWFTKVIENHKENHQYVKAALVYRNKMNDAFAAQDLLLEGWRTNKDAFNCLNNYFENIKDYSQLGEEIKRVYTTETNETNKESFLQVLKHEYQKDISLKEVTKDIAYEIISEKVETNKYIASELIHFNKNNLGITKDVMKFKSTKNKKS
ncbi:MAG: hypothetical protein J0L86_07020 [Flavobacteriales bacterium]|nr:hypothetical protein [Flavobacteriales bacterium]